MTTSRRHFGELGAGIFFASVFRFGSTPGEPKQGCQEKQQHRAADRQRKDLLVVNGRDQKHWADQCSNHNTSDRTRYRPQKRGVMIESNDRTNKQQTEPADQTRPHELPDADFALNDRPTNGCNKCKQYRADSDQQKERAERVAPSPRLVRLFAHDNKYVVWDSRRSLEPQLQPVF